MDSASSERPAARQDSVQQAKVAPSEARAFLSSFLGRTLRVEIADGRMFRGEMKCTDRERNIILANTHEYRAPTKKMVEQEAQKLISKGKLPEGRSIEEQAASAAVNSTARFVGLVVMPGKDVIKVEVEEYTGFV